MLRKSFVFILFTFLYTVSYSQEDAWVYMVDKDNVAAAIANPVSILTQKAIDRKRKYNISIDARDVPISESYISQLKSASGITVKAKSKWFNAVHVRGNQTDIQALENLTFVSHVVFANKNLNTSKRTTQKQFNTLEETVKTFNYGSAENQIKMFNGDALHRLDYTGAAITIAVLDSGFPNVNSISGFTQIRNANTILDTYDFVNREEDVYSNSKSNHGTLVLSNLAGFIENQFVGTAPEASYYLYITEDEANETPVEESYWVEAVERADSLGVDIVNTSLGYSDFDGTKYDYTPLDMNGNTTFITRGANIAFEKGLLVVVAAGNSGNTGVAAPADSPNVLTVGAVDASGNYALFSSVGTIHQPTQKPDVVAQGASSYVITENNIISTASGTSFSAPTLAGGIACLWQALPNKNNAEIMQLVKESASQFNTPDNLLGYGIPDLQFALSSGLSTSNVEVAIKDVDVYPNPATQEIYVTVPSEVELYQAFIYDVQGHLIESATVSKNNNKVDVSALATGLYLVKVQSKNIVKNFKIVKR